MDSEERGCNEGCGTSSLKYKTVAICMGKESLLADRDDSVLGKESINGGWSV